MESHISKKLSIGVCFLMAVIVFFVINLNALANNNVSIIFRDDEGNPITTALDLRVSLWDSYDTRSGEIDANGDINVSAKHYGYYQTTWTITPDENGYFLPNTYGYYRFDATNMSDFPVIAPQNSFLQLEYKLHGAPNTDYKIYDFMDDPPFQNVTRLLIDNNAVYYTNEAGPRSNYNTFTLDANNNAPTNIKLQFGETLAEFLQWSKTNIRFELSDNLYIDGSLTLNGHLDFALNEMVNARLENLASAPTCDSGSKGRLFYDTTDNLPYYCNGTTWNQL